jgi:hypothetical protein
MGHILNLVFDNWKEDGTPLPNLNHLNSDGEKLILPFYIFVLNPPEIELNFCKPENVTENGLFYYFIHFNESLYDGSNWEIPIKIEDLIRNKNLRIVFYNEHESYTNPKNYYQKLLSTIKSKNLDESLFYIVNNSSELYETKNLYPSNLNVFKTNYLIELISKYISIETSIENFTPNKKFLFLCQNRRPKPHRVSLITLLNSEGLLSQENVIDWSLTYGIGNNFQFNSENFESEYFLSDESFVNSFNKIKSEKKLSYFEKNNDWFNTESKYDANHHICLDTHSQSYFNIVTESHYSIESVHITEKSFKPFYYFQIPIFVASHRHIEFLRKEHDLYLFDDIVDHSYDSEPNMSKRLFLIVEEIKRLSKMRDEIHKYYSENKDKFIHNHTYIKNFKYQKSMDLFFLSLCQ